MTRQTPLLITLYQVDPEFRLKQLFDKYLAEMELKLGPNFSTENLIVLGHPVYEAAKRTDDLDSYFPRIGIDWTMDSEPVTDLARNFRRQKIDDRLRAWVANYRDRGEKILFADGLEHRESEYEQPSAKNFDDFLSVDGYCESYKRHVASSVSLTGWAAGESGRQTAQRLYQAIDACYPYVASEMSERFKTAELMIVSSPELNIKSDLRTDLEGFELTMQIKHIKTSLRFVPSYSWPKRPDIYAVGSNSKLFGEE